MMHKINTTILQLWQQESGYIFATMRQVSERDRANEQKCIKSSVEAGRMNGTVR